MIRQAISCDICGTEMQHTNHWFVAYDQGGELRVSGWSARSRLRAGAKHLCGQTCLHKLVDDFMARTLSARASSATDKSAAQEKTLASAALRNDASCTSATIHAAPPRAAASFPGVDEFDSSARLITPLQIPVLAGPSRALPLRLAVAEPTSTDAEIVADAGAAPGYSSRKWRAEAWMREREREQRSKERPASGSARRHSIA